MSSVVAFYGKVRIPTIGHAKAIDYAKGLARQYRGKLSIALSGTSHPLTLSDKKTLARKIFQHPVEVGERHTQTLSSYLEHLGQRHDELHLVAGSDRVQEYRRFIERYNNKPDRKGKTLFNFRKWEVHSVPGNRSDSNRDPTQMSQSELESTVSASKIERLAKEGNYEHFRAYHPGLSDSYVKRLFNKIRGSRLMKEEIDHKNFGPMLDSFVAFASKRLGLKSRPNIQYMKNDKEGSSFGGYNPNTNDLMIVTQNRHPMDIFRTIAHELVHHRQNTEGKLGHDIAKEGETGSDIENEANTEAGIIMRNWAKENPQNFCLSYVTEEVIEEGINDPSTFKVVFLAGGPGSGKDFVLSKTLAGHGMQEINSDHAFEMLLDKHGLSRAMPDEEEEPRNKVRGRSKNITHDRNRLAIAGRKGLIINGTADDPAKIARIRKGLHKLGYESKMVFVDTTNETSRIRNLERGKAGGRTVPEDLRQQKWSASQRSRETYRRMFGNDHFHEIDNSEDIRFAHPDVKKRVMDSHVNLHKTIRKFVNAPLKNPEASKWYGKQQAKRGLSRIKRPMIKEDINDKFRILTERKKSKNEDEVVINPTANGTPNHQSTHGPSGLPKADGVGPTFSGRSSIAGRLYSSGASVPISEEWLPEKPSIRNWIMNENTQIKYYNKYGAAAAQKLIETAYKLESIPVRSSGPKKLREFRSMGYDEGPAFKSVQDDIGSTHLPSEIDFTKIGKIIRKKKEKKSKKL